MILIFLFLLTITCFQVITIDTLKGNIHDDFSRIFYANIICQTLVFLFSYKFGGKSQEYYRSSTLGRLLILKINGFWQIIIKTGLIKMNWDNIIKKKIKNLLKNKKNI